MQETEMNREILVALSLLAFQGIVSAQDWGIDVDGSVGLSSSNSSESSVSVDSAGTSTSPEATQLLVAELGPEKTRSS